MLMGNHSQKMIDLVHFFGEEVQFKFRTPDFFFDVTDGSVEYENRLVNDFVDRVMLELTIVGQGDHHNNRISLMVSMDIMSINDKTACVQHLSRQLGALQDYLAHVQSTVIASQL